MSGADGVQPSDWPQHAASAPVHNTNLHWLRERQVVMLQDQQTQCLFGWYHPLWVSFASKLGGADEKLDYQRGSSCIPTKTESEQLSSISS